MGTKKTKLKGGSLSSTYFVEEDDKKFIRKCVSLTKDREYGYVRWYSQLKKLQRFESDLPGLFPKILNVSYDGDEAYFDLEYLKNYQNISEILLDKSLAEYEVEKIYHAFVTGLRAIHKISYAPNPGAPLLYFKEEVEQKLNDARKFQVFNQFYELGTYEYDNRIIHGLSNYLDELTNYFTELKLDSEEHIHGNPTLENTMYSITDDKVVFIDPYEESIIDTKFLDYAMVLQSSRSYYEIYNEGLVTYEDEMPKMKMDDAIPEPLKYFNYLFQNNIKEEDRKLVDILEATQFIRMLPFKCAAGHLSHAKYFYLHACKLLGNCLSE
jgi:hypothetical protein